MQKKTRLNENLRFSGRFKKNHSGTLASANRRLTFKPPNPSEYKPHQEPDVPTEIRSEMADEGANKASVVSSSGQRGSCVEADRPMSWPAVNHDLRHRRTDTMAGSGGDGRARAAAVSVESVKKESEKGSDGEGKTDDDADA